MHSFAYIKIEMKRQKHKHIDAQLLDHVINNQILWINQ